MATSSNQRRVTRFTVEPMYSSVSVTHGGRDAVDGHVYEVGLGGVRLELDEPLPNRASVDLAITLPGCNEAIAARGRVVEVYDAADDPGPRRMVVEFESFKEGAEATLERYLSQKWLRRAPESQHAPRESQQEAPRDPQRTESPRARTSASASASSRKAKSASAA